MTDTNGCSASAAGTLTLGGELTVNRLGFGAMRITGEGVWGDPPDREAAKAVLRRAVELDVNLIDTADSYGPEVSEQLIGEALTPYPEDMVIATKAGLTRSGPGRWEPNGRPDHIRQACDGSLRRLRVDAIPLYQLHRIDPDVDVAESLGTMVELRQEGKVRLIGVSNVTLDELRQCQSITPIVSVQNRYNVVDRKAEEVVQACAEEGIAFIPWLPLATGGLGRDHDALAAASERLGATPRQVVLAWLLGHSSTMAPIPGTGSTTHLEENIGAARLTLTDDERAALDDAA